MFLSLSLALCLPSTATTYKSNPQNHTYLSIINHIMGLYYLQYVYICKTGQMNFSTWTYINISLLYTPANNVKGRLIYTEKRIILE